MAIAYIITIPKDLKLENIFKDSVTMSEYILYNSVTTDIMNDFLDKIKSNLFISNIGDFEYKNLFGAFRRYFRKKEYILGTIKTNEECDMIINLNYDYIKDRTKQFFQQEGLINNIERID